MAACLANLNSLYVTACEMMEEIIAQEINTEKEKVLALYSLANLNFVLNIVLFDVLEDIFH